MGTRFNTYLKTTVSLIPIMAQPSLDQQQRLQAFCAKAASEYVTPKC